MYSECDLLWQVKLLSMIPPSGPPKELYPLYIKPTLPSAHLASVREIRYKSLFPPLSSGLCKGSGLLEMLRHWGDPSMAPQLTWISLKPRITGRPRGYFSPWGSFCTTHSLRNPLMRLGAQAPQPTWNWIRAGPCGILPGTDSTPYLAPSKTPHINPCSVA